jgi:hypothetical protein
MIGFTPAEFNQVREAIAAAHLYCQAISPLLKARHTMMNKDQRQLAQFAPQAVAEGFNTIALITHRENRDPDTLESQSPTKLTDIDRASFRDELENVSALALPDLVYEMVTALGELPMYHHTLTTEPFSATHAATLMAWTWESGRRYGIQQALAIIECTTREFANGTTAALTQVLDSALDLPAAPTRDPIAANGDGTDRPGPTLVTDDARSTAEPFEYPDADAPTTKTN